MIASPPLVHHNLIASAITIAACTDASSKPSKQLCIFYSHHRPQMLDISPLILQYNSNNRKKWILCSFCFYHYLLSITVCRGSSSWWSPGNIPEFQMQEADKASSLVCTLGYYWKSLREPRNMTNV